MDNYAIFIAPDPEDDEILIYDMGEKEAMSQSFEHLIVEGKEEGNIYLCRVVKSAEVVEPDKLNVVDFGDIE